VAPVPEPSELSKQSELLELLELLELSGGSAGGAGGGSQRDPLCRWFPSFIDIPILDMSS
jgi:hypothetical protein